MQISHARLEDLTNISYPPHSINVELGKELGYDDDVLDLMQKLPYVNRPDHWWDRKDIWDDTDFADYRLEDYLRIVGRRPFWRFNDEPCIESHILPIAYPHRNYGWLMLLDTKLGKFISSFGARKSLLIYSRSDSRLHLWWTTLGRDRVPSR